MLNKFKSHFRLYTKSQRNGIFILLIFIIFFQFIFFSIKSIPSFNINLEENLLQKQIDCLKIIKRSIVKQKIQPFNPNFISDFKGYHIGMSIDEIDRLHDFRNNNQWINSIKQFQIVTKVSDSLLAKISPNFKFPEWVAISKNNKKSDFISTPKKYIKKEVVVSTNDINKANQTDFSTIIGIGEILSARIIKYRTKIKGFSFQSQVYEVDGLSKEVVNCLLSSFKIIDKPIIYKLNINTATFKEVLSIHYIDYSLCKEIFNYRDEVAELQHLDQLKNIPSLSHINFERISLYLKAE